MKNVRYIFIQIALVVLGVGLGGEATFNGITFQGTRMIEGAAGNYSPRTVMEFDHGGVMEKMLDVLGSVTVK